ncbi:GIDE domain-containing protein [Stenotrophobium rhamnosiphilum]|uniref:RING-type E3 ubiquitin transferase n=1 Tax=Stenotrophobium rhamnosiphilum TaxID=2029166 RepID=A0A2T5MJC0_9GAMM|nr:GIDE domain-containing protein [Stenotrophobium rhamnosiphilum]PTU32665.1 hypothetical protein CJD38_00635 [Stenotrophobium rhamnosiphilum]
MTALTHAILNASSGHLLLALLITVLGGLVLLGLGFMYIYRARLLEDTPSSLIRSAAQGYVELNGHARLLPGPPIVSPLSDTPCAWWSFRVQERDRNGKNNHWRTVEEETSGELFLLADPTGECIVDPDDASVTPSLSRSWSGPVRRPHRPPDGSGWLSFGDFRYTEKLILIGAPLYATGWFRTQTAILDLNESRDVSELMGEWKRDKYNLLKRFDSNNDGQIDMQEWEAARRAALEHVRAQHVELSLDPDLHVLSNPPDRRPFILSTLTQKSMTRRYRFWALLNLLGAIGCGWLCAYALQLRDLF